MKKLTLGLIGDSAVGKTSILLTFLGAQIPDDHQPTDLGVEEFVATVEDPLGEPLNLSIWDTAGSEDYDRYRRIAYNSNPDAFLICFSIDDHDSLINVNERWIPILKNFCPNVPIILVANKIDLRNDLQTVEQFAERGQILVTTEIGKLVQQDIGACAYFECSSRTGECIPVVFEFVTKKKFKHRLPNSAFGRLCAIL